jgi:pimeloyl-ACP methyl ester carboxylesterase
MDLKDFILAGHSVGGFTVGLYALQYPTHIKKLLMFSPAGVHSKPEDFDLDAEIDSFPAERRMPKFVYKLTPYVWKTKISPFGLMRTSGSWIANLSLNKFVQKRLRAGVVPENEIRDYKEYLH